MRQGADFVGVGWQPPIERGLGQKVQRQAPRKGPASLCLHRQPWHWQQQQWPHWQQQWQQKWTQRPHSDQGQGPHQLWSPGLDALAMMCVHPDGQEQGP